MFLVATSVLNHPEQVLNGSKIDVRSYESWLANKKVFSLLNSIIINALHSSLLSEKTNDSAIDNFPD